MNIKDYLHLYLPYKIKCVFHSANIHRLTIPFYESALNNVPCKPILRPLSDMTEEEKKECPIVIEDRDMFELTRLLLSKHFDLFGLIEAGLAIDKTTLNYKP